MFSMKPRKLLAVILTLCFGFVLFALYLQHYKDVSPCPLCVLQRYTFIIIGLICLFALITGMARISAAFGFVFSVAGAMTAAYQLWIIAHPAISCGRDYTEEVINRFFMARWIPGVFRSEGYCADNLDPILMLTPPQWTLVWFSVFAIALLWIALKKRRSMFSR